MRKNKILLGLLVTIIVLTMVFSGCAKTEPAPEPTPTPTPTPAPEPAPSPEEPIKLTLSYYMGTKAWLHTGVFEPWKQQVEEATDGRVIIELFPGGALGKAQDHYDMVANGIADIGWSLESYTPGRFPLSSISELPYMFNSVTDAGRAKMMLFDEFPEYQAEYKDTHMLALSATSWMELGMRDKLVKVPSDLNGTTLRVSGDVQGSYVGLAGGSEVGIPMAEVYSSVETGVVDGLITDAGIFLGFKLCEVAPYTTIINGFAGGMFTVMNQDTWDSLPPDIQDIFNNEVGGIHLTDLHSSAKEAHIAAGLKYMEANSKEYYIPTEAELNEWKALSTPVYEEWIKTMEDQGLPGQAVFDRAVEISKELSK